MPFLYQMRNDHRHEPAGPPRLGPARVRFLPPWTDFPTDDPLADTERMNDWIEREIRRLPAQYLWVHKRFKTRPQGEDTLY